MTEYEKYFTAAYLSFFALINVVWFAWIYHKTTQRNDLLRNLRDLERLRRAAATLWSRTLDEACPINQRYKIDKWVTDLFDNHVHLNEWLKKGVTLRKSRENQEKSSGEHGAKVTKGRTCAAFFLDFHNKKAKKESELRISASKSKQMKKLHGLRAYMERERPSINELHKRMYAKDTAKDNSVHPEVEQKKESDMSGWEQAMCAVLINRPKSGSLERQSAADFETELKELAAE
jgi:hypothetical protein